VVFVTGAIFSQRPYPARAPRWAEALALVVSPVRGTMTDWDPRPSWRQTDCVPTCMDDQKNLRHRGLDRASNDAGPGPRGHVIPVLQSGNSRSGQGRCGNSEARFPSTRRERASRNATVSARHCSNFPQARRDQASVTAQPFSRIWPAKVGGRRNCGKLFLSLPQPPRRRLAKC